MEITNRSIVRRAIPMLLAATLAIFTAGASADVPNAPTLPIEQMYYAEGPWDVTESYGFACCDSEEYAYDAWYPTNLGQGGFSHPIVVYGSGTGGSPAGAAYLLRHLASWGFVVIGSQNGQVGNGQSILDAAAYMVSLNGNSGSPFYGVLDTANIGAIGQSQGAYGVVNALVNGGTLIKTIVAIELPPQWACTVAPFTCQSTTNITSGSVFFVNGSASLISPSFQLDPCTVYTENSLTCLYNHTPASIPKVWATLEGANHTDVTGQPGCDTSPAPATCNNGVYGFLGYPTAWLMDKLQGDSYAHGAFVSGTGEIFQETTNWKNQNSNIQ